MEVTMMSPGDLVPYGRNVRRHPKAQIDRLKKSIAEFGFTQPIVVDETRTVIVGHGRLLAARDLGLDQVPVVVLDGLSAKQKTAYRILDNKLGDDSTWEFENLQAELEALAIDDFDFEPWDLRFVVEEDVALPEAPRSVIENKEELELIKEKRRAGNKDVSTKEDTERFLVLVFDTRDDKAEFLAGIGLPEEERYVVAGSFDIRPKPMIKVGTKKSSDPRKTGACGGFA